MAIEPTWLVPLKSDTVGKGMQATGWQPGGRGPDEQRDFDPPESSQGKLLPHRDVKWNKSPGSCASRCRIISQDHRRVGN